LLAILNNVNEPQRIGEMLATKDLFGQTGFNIMVNLNLLDCLMSNSTDRVLQNYWKSTADTSGSFFGHASNYDIIRNTNLAEDEDYEAKFVRFWLPEELSSHKDMPHAFSFNVWKESM
jgi:hypothetical protein